MRRSSTTSLPRELASLLATATTLLSAGESRAEPALSSYEVVQGCPAEDWIDIELSVVFGGSKPAALSSFSLDVVATPDGFDGALSSISLGFFRELSAESCTAVLRGLALALAVYLETRDSGDAEAASKSTHSTPSPVPIGGVEEPEARAAPDATSGKRPRRAASVLLGSEFRNGIAPRAFPTVRLGASVAEFGPGWAGGFRFSLFLNHQPQTHHVSHQALSPRPAEASVYEWTAASLHACPWLPELTPIFRIGPCASVYAGDLWLRRDPERWVERGWFGFAEIGVQLEANFSKLTLSSSAGTHVPLNRLSFQFRGEEIHRQQDGFSAGLSLGLQL